MDVRARDLANKMAHAAKQLFTLPVHAARRKAREIIGQAPKDGQLAVVENWRELADGQIEFAVRYFNDPGPWPLPPSLVNHSPFEGPSIWAHGRFAYCIRYRLGLRRTYNSKAASRASLRSSNNFAQLISRMRCVQSRAKP
jgi:hypothetical protein